MATIKWGLVGTGYICDKFAEGFRVAENCKISAVASRDIAKAREFALKHGIEKYYGSYEEMSMDKDFDVIYIGTPHTAHLENVLMFLEAGFNVLSEKPMGVNAEQTRVMIEKAREKNVFLMEGMWTRFFPAVKTALEWVRNGRIGTPKTLFSNFGIDSSADKDQWRFKNSMAGGALLDVGIYPLAITFAFFGSDPKEILTTAVVENGIDEYNTITLKYADRKIAVLGSALSAKMENKVVISGSEGCLVIGNGYDWWRAKDVELYKGGSIFAYTEKVDSVHYPYETFGFQYEIEAVSEYVRRGLKEAPEMTLEESLKIAATMDLLRGKWGIIYNEDIF